MRVQTTPLLPPGDLRLMPLDGDEALLCNPADRDLAEWLCSGSDLTFEEWVAPSARSRNYESVLGEVNLRRRMELRDVLLDQDHPLEELRTPQTSDEQWRLFLEIAEGIKVDYKVEFPAPEQTSVRILTNDRSWVIREDGEVWDSETFDLEGLG